MNIFFTLLVLLCIGLGLTMLIPILSIGVALLSVLACLFIWVFPIVLIASSEKVTGGEKVAWILAIIFLSWFACIFYFLLAPLKEKPSSRQSNYRQYRY